MKFMGILHPRYRANPFAWSLSAPVLYFAENLLNMDSKQTMLSIDIDLNANR